jgi:GH43 family beta-xylosidase
MIFHGGFYYCSEAGNNRHIHIHRSRTMAGISNNSGTRVWTAPARGSSSANIWAPELHLVDGKWFIYYSADDGNNDNRRMWVLESVGADPCGRYICRGCLQTGGWAIDGTMLTLDDGRKYLLWSGRPARREGQQNIYIASMRDPVTITSPRTLIASPDQPWERAAEPICEGPQVLKRNGEIFVVYSASVSWLGLLHNKTRDLLNPSAWIKYGPVFKRTDQIWGLGHFSFVKSLGQSEDWLIYHSKSTQRSGWEDRDVHAQRFTWTSDGFPDFEVAPRPHTVSSRINSCPRVLAAAVASSNQ